MAPPGFSSKKTTSKSSSTSGGPPGTSSGKSREDIGRELDREITRRTYFDGRQDVSDDRLDRRLVQAQEEKAFISTLKPVEGTGGTLLQEQAPVFNPRTGRYERTTLADKRIQLANKYGPTFGELASDMGYAFGSMAKGAGDILQSGSFGIIGILKDVANYALDKANQGYDKLNSVQQEIFDNPDKYPYASKVPQVEAVNNSRQLALEADRDALGLELDALMAEREFRYNNPTVDMRKPTREGLEAIDIDDSYVESGQFKSDLEKSGIITVDDPSTQESFSDSTKIPGKDATLGDLKKALKDQGLNDIQIQSAVNEIGQQIISGQYTGDFEVDTGSTTTDDQVSFTPYDNPFNLEFRGQEGAEPGYGGPEGDRFAKFADLDTGIKAGISRVADIVGEGKSTDEFLNIYAPRSDNQESYDNYLATLQEKVGETIEPDEIKPLTEGIVKFENKPELADQYLNYLEQEKDKLYSGIVS